MGIFGSHNRAEKLVNLKRSMFPFFRNFVRQFTDIDVSEMADIDLHISGMIMLVEKSSNIDIGKISGPEFTALSLVAVHRSGLVVGDKKDELIWCLVMHTSEHGDKMHPAIVNCVSNYINELIMPYPSDYLDSLIERVGLKMMEKFG